MAHCIIMLIALALCRSILFFSNEYLQEAFKKDTCKNEMLKHNEKSNKVVKFLDYFIYFLILVIIVSLF